ncbi:MAG: hypothetical protein ACPGSC_15480, partial [Granulosicoccaceae bacterium]
MKLVVRNKAKHASVGLFALLTAGMGNCALADNSTRNFQLDAWSDNWFAAWNGEVLIVEDSVPITTERSFNKETASFSAQYPLHLNFLLKDFKENNTGLEYIGSRRQQMGDGGFIMQVHDQESGDVVAVSSAAMKCVVLHEAPLDKSCKNERDPQEGVAPCEHRSTPEPEDWKLGSFDDGDWIQA